MVLLEPFIDRKEAQYCFDGIYFSINSNHKLGFPNLKSVGIGL
jgi:hypothetical protein